MLVKIIHGNRCFLSFLNVKFAGMDLGRTWKMKQERLSNRYTSRIDEIIRVKCNLQLE
ncbi:DUF4113 domain-containing protein [Salegentibacter sp. JZCK2]|uniref:DUF4113 domain-containing protein n=1 Tax=Salegentibacter tibetensis TaxID=2873600 RepID=UPI001CCC6702|nr:DUF4113 domain-containing protein [Salegentibacter tibetensis]MBZ9731422.1 DUF4113 domain-containing protein [Salegentibacter tibetensis]